MDVNTANGSFSAEFAANKRWKLNAGLQAVLEHLCPANSSVMDLGAGYGKYVEWLLGRDVDAYGCDGIHGVYEASHGLVTQVDLSEAGGLDKMHDLVPNDLLPLDLAVCVEVGEHVPEHLLPQFIANVTGIRAKRYLVSWATPGQRGRDHVSCRSPEWVANAWGQRGWTMDDAGTREVRKIGGKGWNRKMMLLTR